MALRSFPNRYLFSLHSKVTSLFSIRYILEIILQRIFLEKHTGENPETYARMKQKDEYPEITHRNPTAGIYGKQYSYHLPIKQTAPV